MKKLALRFEQRPDPSGWIVLFYSVLALLAAFFITGIIFWAYGVDPLVAYAKILKGSLGSQFALFETLRRAIPLLLVGVGLALCFRMLFWNIGAEGQLLMGAVGATWVALFSGIPEQFMVVSMFVVGALAGALWGLIPALLRSKMAINEVITTLMMNYIAAFIVVYLIQDPWRGTEKRGFAYTNTFPKAAWLETIGSSSVPWITLILGLLVAVGVYFLMDKTTVGYEIRVIGDNPRAGTYAGMGYTKATGLVMLISGGLAGLAGVGEMAGNHHFLLHPDQVSLGYGYTAIMVAWLARTNPLAAILTAFLFGAMMSGGDTIKISLGIPFQVIGVINGLILFFIIASERLMHTRILLKSSLQASPENPGGRSS